MNEIQKFISERWQNEEHILLGNSLCKLDYSESEWDNIGFVRVSGGWESPRSLLMNALLHNDFHHSVEEVKTCDWFRYFDSLRLSIHKKSHSQSTIATCRFDTRIDYILFSEPLSSAILLKSYERVECSHTVFPEFSYYEKQNLSKKVHKIIINLVKNTIYSTSLDVQILHLSFIMPTNNKPITTK
jgi:hypothetical protein